MNSRLAEGNPCIFGHKVAQNGPSHSISNGKSAKSTGAHLFFTRVGNLDAWNFFEGLGSIPCLLRLQDWLNQLVATWYP